MLKHEFDGKTAYCHSLGHYVPFRYCRTVNSDIPCGKIQDCWFELLDIARYLSDNYTGEELGRIFAPPPAKITTLVDLINKAQGKG